MSALAGREIERRVELECHFEARPALRLSIGDAVAEGEVLQRRSPDPDAGRGDVGRVAKLLDRRGKLAAIVRGHAFGQNALSSLR